MADEIKPLVEILPNGMHLVVLENHSSPVVSIQAWVRVGSADEPEEMAGVSHLLEHMLFKGTEKRNVGEIAREIESNGGYINAFTTYDATVYYVTIASRYFETGIDVLADAIQNSSFVPDELEREKEVVIEEIKRSEDIPERKAMNDIFELAYKVHPYKRPIIGFADKVKAITRERLIDYYKKWYSPDNITLVVSGDADKEAILRAVEKYFGGFKKSGASAALRPQEPEQNALRVKVSKESVFETQLILAFHIPGVLDKDIYALDVLSSLMGEGDSSILYKEIKRNKELVNSIYTYTYTPRDTGLFIVGASLEAKDIENAIKSIWEEILKIRKHPPAYNELSRAKIKIESDFIYQKETVEGTARQLGYFEAIIGDVNYEKRYLEGLKNVNAEDIRQVAEKYLVPDNLSIVILGPVENPAIGEEIKQFIYEKKIGEDRERPEAMEVSRIVLDNGIRLIVKSTPGTETVSIYSASLGGVRYENERTSGLSNMLSRVWTKGTKTRSAEEIADEIEELGGEIAGYSGRNTFGLSAQFLSRFIDKGIALYTDVLFNPTFSEDEIEKARREIFNEIKNQEDDLARIAFKNFYKTLYGAHPYGMDILGTKASVEKLTRKDILKYYTQFLRPDNLVIAVVGDFELNETIDLLKTKFAQIPGKKTKMPAIKKVEPLNEIKRSEKTVKEKEQVHILIGFLGTTVTSDDQYPLQVLDAILSGQGGRLFVKLRDEQSLAYDLRALNVPGIDPGYFALYIASGAEKEEQAIQGLIGEIKNVLETGVSEEEVERAKKYIVGNYEISLQSNSSMASNIALNEIYNLGYDFYKKFPEKINSVTVDNVNKVAKKYLALDKYVLSIIKPEKNK